MKRLILSIMMLTMVFIVTSCSKSFNPNDEGLTDSENHQVFTATISEGTKTTLSGGNVNWIINDEISVNGAKYKAKTGGSTTTEFVYVSGSVGNSPYKAYYPYSIYDGTTATLPSTQKYESTKPFSVNPMYAKSEGMTLQFYNICVILAIKVGSEDISSVNTITVSSSNKAMCGAFYVDDNNVAVLSETTDVSKQVTLNCNNCAISSETTFYVAIPAQTYRNLRIDISDGTNHKVMVTKANTDISVARNTIYTINFSQNISLLSNNFSVSATKTVKFSPANLYWDGSSFHFEATQADYPSSWNANHVGHFFWTKNANRSYTYTYSDGVCTSDDKFFANGMDADHMLDVDGIKDCYALSKEEWNYLLNTRKVNDNKASYGVGTVMGKHGLIILPDDWNGTVCESFNYGTQSSWTQNTFNEGTAVKWSDMEQAGCVFLPAQGSRNGNNMSRCDEVCFYWTSNPYNDSEGYSTYIVNNTLRTDKNYARNYGRAIRLVQTQTVPQ